MARRTNTPVGEARRRVLYGSGQHRNLHIVPDLVRFEGRKVHLGEVLNVHEASARFSRSIDTNHNGYPRSSLHCNIEVCLGSVASRGNRPTEDVIGKQT